MDAAVPNLDSYNNYTLTFSDTMSAGLTLDASSLKLVIGDAASIDVPAKALKVDENSFTVTLPLKTSNVATSYYNSKVAVIYNATVNANAVAGVADTNKATLNYTNAPSVLTDTMKVWTVQLDLTKVNGNNETITADTATFDLYGATEKTGAATKEIDGATYYKYDTKTTAAGKLSFTGLAAGTYYLVETDAPDGYNLLANPVKVVITTTSAGALTATVDGVDANVATLGHAAFNVQNTTGLVLPGTGGMGTTLFTIGGIALLVCAGGFLFLNRKRVFGE